MVQVTLDEKGVPEYEICEGVAWDHIPFTTQTEELARHCRAVCFGSLAQRGEVSKETILQFISLVPAECLKIFDINLRQHFYSEDIIRHSLAACDILKINDEETLAVAKLFGWNDSSEEEISHRLLKEYKLKAVVETKGVVGSYVFTAEEISYLDTPKVAVVDTVGAGDAFTGALVAGLLQGNTIHEAHRLAVDVSAYVCTRTGAMPE
jgi:fructokinase